MRPLRIAGGSHQPICLEQHTGRIRLRTKREADHSKCRAQQQRDHRHTPTGPPVG